MEPIVRLLARDRLIRILQAYISVKLPDRIGKISVLDVGCGNGFILRECINIGADFNACMGIDLDENLIAEAKTKSPAGFKYHCQRLEEFAADGLKFDIIITSGFFAYFDNHHMKSISLILKNMLNPNGLMITSNYDKDWLKLDNGQLRGLNYSIDGIRAFDFSQNELSQLLGAEFKHLSQHPHLISGDKLNKFSELFNNPSKYSAYESLLDSNAVKATTYLDVYAPC
ncbi:class I SAM-dependent methyltransferase [Pseudoalteromonas denitrificans]|uniref:Methyltransferase domain-containing protein n=1 Tax=Pseudoalteromonas denitrificans DSM 6059 TaxID=1123010 RepID=A0A1I1HKS2_9GAMM|nr:class I SAM-dependent methyltransferase [Pseudoalteromonas denitrificans]SFC24355.1 Methyltransferase domain-containing protein [Pseudoalteromonas denitrificans DSM 6059]